MIYLASPYSHRNPSIQDARFRQVRIYTAELLRNKIPVFSPIVYGYQFEKDFGFAGDAKTWEHINHKMIEACDAVHVLMLSGWRESLGVAREVQFALNLPRPVHYVSMPE